MERLRGAFVFLALSETVPCPDPMKRLFFYLEKLIADRYLGSGDAEFSLRSLVHFRAVHVKQKPSTGFCPLLLLYSLEPNRYPVCLKKIVAYIMQLASEKFFGTVTLSFPNGRICYIKVERNMKLTDL